MQERPQTEEIRRRGVSIGNHHHHLSIANDDRHVGASLSGLMVIMALSFHEILEGLAVGLQRDTSDILQLFGAIAAHKYGLSRYISMDGSSLVVYGFSCVIHLHQENSFGPVDTYLN